MQKDVLIEATSLSKRNDHLEVLRAVDIKVYCGEMLSITGKSGAGKSTLIHLLGSLDTPDNGKVLIEGQDIYGLTANDLANFRNKNIGFVFQFHYLLQEFTAIENVSIPGMIQGTPKDTLHKKAADLLDRLGLKDRKDHKPSELSGGEQQRVAVARALINDPKVIIADEPTGNLDNQNSSELYDLFLELKKTTGQTFVIVTHNQELARRGDRIITLADGQIEHIEDLRI